MSNGAGQSASMAADFAYAEDAPGMHGKSGCEMREALRNFPLNIGARTVWSIWLKGNSYDYAERHDEVEAWVLEEAKDACRKAYPDGKHPFLTTEKLPADFLRDSYKPPSSRTLRQAAHVRRFMRTVERRARSHNHPLPANAGTYAGGVPRVRPEHDEHS